MIVAVDVHYREREVVAAAVGFASWTATKPCVEVVVTSDAPPVPYEPGQFYRRELPHLRCVLGTVSTFETVFEAVIVDGYVWLAPGHKGLGAHLYDELGATNPVIGVAKTAYAGAIAIEVVRGTSTRPLYVTAVGLDASRAAEHVRGMAGEHRIPMLLKRVDQLCRGTA